MNSFSFLIAFVAACTLPINAFPALDCGSGPAPLIPGQILAPGKILTTGTLVSSGSSYHHGSELTAGADSLYAHGATYAGADDIGAYDGHGHGNGGAIVESIGKAQVTALRGHSADNALLPAADPCEEPPKVLIHQQRHAIIVNRPSTNVVVDQPAIVVKPNPVVIKRPPGVVVRPVIKHVQPNPVKVQPVFVRYIKPVEKHYVKKTYDDCEGPVWSHTKVLPDC